MTNGEASPNWQDRSGRWWRARRRIFEAWVKASIQPGTGWFLKTDLYDEAAGPFHHAAGMPEKAAFLGIDVDPVVVRSARNRLRNTNPGAAFVVADVRHLPFAAGSVPWVFSLSTLDHFDSQQEIGISLGELARVLTSRGQLFLILDNPLNPEVALRGWLPEGMRNRLRSDRFMLGALVGASHAARLLNESGFRIVEQGYAVHALRYPTIRLLDLLVRLDMSGAAEPIEWAVERQEWLGRLPSGSFTGHYITWVAVADQILEQPAPEHL